MTKMRSCILPVMLMLGFCFLRAVPVAAQGSLEKVAVSLHDGWFVQSSANVTATGATISTPGFTPTGW